MRCKYCCSQCSLHLASSPQCTKSEPWSQSHVDSSVHWLRCISNPLSYIARQLHEVYQSGPHALPNIPETSMHHWACLCARLTAALSFLLRVHWCRPIMQHTWCHAPMQLTFGRQQDALQCLFELYAQHMTALWMPCSTSLGCDLHG